MFSIPQQFLSKLIEKPQAKTNTLKLPLSNNSNHYFNPHTLIKQANKMISKSLGKLHKVRAQGEDNQGNSYQSLEQMW